MADFVFNISKGRVAYLADLPAASDSLIAVPLETSGLEADSVLRDADSLADVVAGSTNEQTSMGRKTLSGVTNQVDDANDYRWVDVADATWATATGNPISAIVICYVPSSGASDSNIVPLVKLDVVATPTGGDLIVQFNAAGIYRAS